MRDDGATVMSTDEQGPDSGDERGVTDEEKWSEERDLEMKWRNCFYLICSVPLSFSEISV